MAVFRDYTARLLHLVPTILRRRADNVLYLWHRVLYEGAEKVAEALQEFGDVSYPLDTASGWVLDEHHGPYQNLQRNGMDDATYRLYIRAKRMLNHSWGAADQALVILRFLLGPKPTLDFTFWGNKHWEIAIGDADLAETAQALEFMRKRPSPEGGGFSVAGDNGWGKTWDANVMCFSSIQGPVSITGSWSSIQGPSGGLEAGWAHVVPI